MTLAEQYRTERPKDFANTEEWASFILTIDDKSIVQATDLGPVIIFSDDSKHLMDRK